MKTRLSSGHISYAPLVRDVFELLSYEADKGLLTWRKDRSSGVKAGDCAGSTHRTGYVRVSIGGRSYQAHRIAWLMHYGEWPADLVDHINGDKSDNRITNLRLATIQENGRNRKANRGSSSGITGVRWSKTAQRWCPHITVDGVTHHLGSYKTKAEAVRVRRAAECDEFGAYSYSASQQAAA